MPIKSIFSRRQKKLRGDYPDVYQYDEIPKKLRNQIVLIIQEHLLQEYSDETNTIFNVIRNLLCKEYGVFYLYRQREDDIDDVLNFFLEVEDIEQALDVVELVFDAIDNYIRNKPYSFRFANPDKAILELNMRLQEAGVGFKFESGQIIKVDSEFLHSEVVKPVLHLLGTNKIYEGINNEFLKAHEHYRHQKYKECLVFCAKSIESLLKAIHEKNKWEYKETDTYAKLINSSFDNSLIPNYLENQFSGLKQLLATGVNVIRNREGAHGQGSEIKEIPEHLASYVLHLTASNLLFLMKSAVNN